MKLKKKQFVEKGHLDPNWQTKKTNQPMNDDYGNFGISKFTNKHTKFFKLSMTKEGRKKLAKDKSLDEEMQFKDKSRKLTFKERLLFIDTGAHPNWEIKKELKKEKEPEKKKSEKEIKGKKFNFIYDDGSPAFDPTIKGSLTPFSIANINEFSKIKKK